MTSLSTNQRRRTLDSTPVRVTLISGALLYVAVFLLMPLAAVFTEAFAKGWKLYVAALNDPDALAAIRLTLATVVITVPLNAAFGLAAAWATTRFEFRGKELLITLIDLPLAVSPVISGLVYVLLFGMQGWFGPWLQKHDLQIIFAVPGIVLATVFVTFPFVARELIPFMQSQGAEQDEAASVLGARGWSLLYGVILCTARAMGEFGAVSVVSGHVRGETNTVPLQVEILYNEYNFTAAFALASILTLLALVTLIAKKLIEWKTQRSAEAGL
jgi:sulfate transport system permease protein